ncbi:YbfB/YjiJ family MFS transporter [Blastococcus sp. Marseille-P5729]|uniref:YbfB/YjiJ family MFS transporter n=1 Tax=Blastococcus sp. Marseille-P5729 TaxID=2086582 RepID=UPI000D10E494|nr:YbfB/YjiJ family MFS transporter [Blastococcus sp. Marseille-P5729]
MPRSPPQGESLALRLSPVYGRVVISGRSVTAQALLGMTVAMGIGRFAYTPLMPLMMADGVLTREQGAMVATANYLGYLIGAVVLTLWPQLNTRFTYRVWTIILVLSELLMVPLDGMAGWTTMRFLAGYASAVLFIGIASTLGAYSGKGASAGMAFGGVGIGIALMGGFSLLLAEHLTWQQMWLGTAGISVLLAIGPWLLPVEAESSPERRGSGKRRLPRPMRLIWQLLFAAYFLEGLGYIIIGTFIVAAVGTGTGPSAAVWVVAGLAAIPATVLYGRLAQRVPMSIVLVGAYLLQTIGALLPVVVDATWASFVCAALYGGTFLGIAMLTTSQGRRLPVERAAAALTAGYSIGQVLGPIVVTPVIGRSYGTAFLVAAVVIAAGGLLMTAVAVLIARHGEGDGAPGVSAVSPVRG